MHTCGTWILPEVLGPVSADQSRGLGFRSRTSWEFLVEAHNTRHARSILRGTDSLYPISTIPYVLFVVRLIQLRMEDGRGSH